MFMNIIMIFGKSNIFSALRLSQICYLSGIYTLIGFDCRTLDRTLDRLNFSGIMTD